MPAHGDLCCSPQQSASGKGGKDARNAASGQEIAPGITCITLPLGPITSSAAQVQTNKAQLYPAQALLGALHCTSVSVRTGRRNRCCLHYVALMHCCSTYRSSWAAGNYASCPSYVPSPMMLALDCSIRWHRQPTTCLDLGLTRPRLQASASPPAAATSPRKATVTASTGSPGSQASPRAPALPPVGDKPPLPSADRQVQDALPSCHHRHWLARQAACCLHAHRRIIL